MTARWPGIAGWSIALVFALATVWAAVAIYASLTAAPAGVDASSLSRSIAWYHVWHLVSLPTTLVAVVVLVRRTRDIPTFTLAIPAVTVVWTMPAWFFLIPPRRGPLLAYLSDWPAILLLGVALFAAGTIACWLLSDERRHLGAWGFALLPAVARLGWVAGGGIGAVWAGATGL